MSGYSMHTGPILDYASPRQLGKVRLPSTSRIEVVMERDGVVVREWLQAKAGAIVAMVIAVFTFGMLVIAATTPSHYRLSMGDRIFQAALPGVVGIAEIIVLLLVINNTWRQTVFEARSDSLLLTFIAPFGKRRYEWGASQVEDIRVELTTGAEHRNSLGELELHLAGLPLVKLFSDHPAAELQDLAGRLRLAIRLATSGAGGPALETSHEPDPTTRGS
jgi:hypothetical protein